MNTEQAKAGCEECDWRGWVHSHDPFEIQRCDTCRGGDPGWSDEDAAQAHSHDCACDWPSSDFQSLVSRDLFYCREAAKAYPSIQEHLRHAQERSEDRQGFVLNLREICLEVGLAVAETGANRRARADGNLQDHVEGICRHLLVILSLVWTNAWKDHWVWDYEDGTVKDGKWFAVKPAVLVTPPNTVGLSVLEKGLAEGKTGDQIFAEIFADAIVKATPQLEQIDAVIAEAQRRRPKPELDYKKVCALLDSARRDLGKGHTYEVSTHLEGAMRHLLEIYPDADIPNKSST